LTEELGMAIKITVARPVAPPVEATGRDAAGRDAGGKVVAIRAKAT
jgi:hypothetical protein